MLAPAASSTVSGSSVSLSADADDGDGVGVAHVDFFARRRREEPSSRSAASPRPACTTTRSGTRPISQMASTTCGPPRPTTCTLLRLDGVLNVRVDNDQPTVSVLAPTASSIVHGTTVPLSADASDGGGVGVTQVAFFAQKSGGPIIPTRHPDHCRPHCDLASDTTVVRMAPTACGRRRPMAFNPAKTSATSIANVSVDNTAPTGSTRLHARRVRVRGATNA